MSEGGFTIDCGPRAFARIGADGVRRLTAAATAATFLHEGLQPHERADVQRVIDISGGCCEQASRSPTQHFAAGFAGDVAAGYVIATRHAAGDHELDWLMIHPAFHGTRVSADLMRRGMDWLGVDRPMWLNVLRHNARAIRFYRRFGFEIDPETPTPHLVPHWVMRRPAGALPDQLAAPTPAPDPERAS